MKYLFLFFLLLTSLSVRAAYFVEVELADKREISGEVIEIYKDRWFYQAENKDTPKYILIFKMAEGRPIFYFKNLKDIKNFKFLKFGKSQYKEYIIKNNLLFQNKLVKNADVLTGNEGHHKFERMFGNFAWDIGILDSHGSQYESSGSLLEDYYVYDKEVAAPITGKVVGKVSDQEDNIPDLTFTSDLSNKTNNYLTIHLKDQIYLSIVHFKKDSIQVDIGEKIEVGQVLGTVGNSGVSYIPHLHYTLYLYIPEYNRFISIPGFFK